jgi:hypothetical protein
MLDSQIGLHTVSRQLRDWLHLANRDPAFGIYASTVTENIIPNATLYQSIGWGCLINFFYVVSILSPNTVLD